MTVFEWHAGMVEQTAGLFAFWVKTTREDWLDKHPVADPESKTRSIMEYVKECVGINRRVAAILMGKEPSGQEVAFSDVDDACRQIVESGKEFADAVRAQDESVLHKTFPMPWGEAPGAMVITMPMMNMAYHGGQVNYVQTLYGDTEFRFPSG